MIPTANLQEYFGSIDIYLFDQLLKGNIAPPMKVLDAGCGNGRNVVYLLRSGFQVFGVDQSVAAIGQVRNLAHLLAPQLRPDNFRVEPVEQMSFADATFDVVISSAVLHFARDEENWQSMVHEMWRVLKEGGLFFARLASTIGIEDQIQPIANGRYHLPDGSERFLVNEQMLRRVTQSLSGHWLEPLKTVLVQDMRSMTNWVLRKDDRTS